MLVHLREYVLQILYDLLLRQKCLILNLKGATQLFELSPTDVQQYLAVVVLVLQTFELDLQVVVALDLLLKIIDSLLELLSFFG